MVGMCVSTYSTVPENYSARRCVYISKKCEKVVKLGTVEKTWDLVYLIFKIKSVKVKSTVNSTFSSENCARQARGILSEAAKSGKRTHV